MYLMESAEESRRLLEQEQSQDTRAVLLRTGLAPGTRALDAGCGPGGIAELMAELVGEGGHVTGVDLHEGRVAEARTRNAHRPNVTFLQADVRTTGLPPDAFDYAWSQYVFEYLPDRHVALAELIRVTRPGGRVVVSDIDGLGFQNWPFPEHLRVGTERIVEALAARGFDLYVGRKLYSEFRRAGLTDVRVHLMPFYLSPGAAEARLVRDWKTRFEALAPVGAAALGGMEPYQAHCADFLAMLEDPEGLKYAVTLVTEGTKP
ncbi:methyltransferase domain-containing protein [Corallococcus interemptor]|uniref:methyltransferase domain-containing protein n=1 Tax=Corallococcus TaxID=83461 RepID=UPI001CBC49A3|nr:MULTISPECIES: methyltransferase domain-containing protein [unclassified Corallococcus]MBZ4334065.1 methyltransferase domain-containing protein [Corallococcus sp. AS-1-12]MBZ4370993.1 methyltransferase domain-containing protein [Corallococcus sp. AS-1-6]